MTISSQTPPQSQTSQATVGKKWSAVTFGWRVAVSIVWIALLISLFRWDATSGPSALILLGFCAVLSVRNTWELVRLLHTRSFEPGFKLSSFCTLAVLVAGWLHLFIPWEAAALSMNAADPLRQTGLIALVYAICVMVLFLRGAIRYREPGKAMETLGAELIVVSYAGVLLSVTAQLRWVAGDTAGYLALGSLLVAAKGGDIGAYTFGKLFGRRQMAPHLSPSKTWMGALGALVLASLSSWLWFEQVTPLFHSSWEPPQWHWTLLYGFLIGMVGLVGDLCESLIKRDVGRKDSAALMPGFGGLLDLIDSVLYAGPMAYVLWLILPLRTW